MKNVGTTSSRNLSVQEITKRLDDLPDGTFSGDESELTYAEEQFNFSWALSEIKQNIKMRRTDWALDEFVFLVPGSNFKVNRAPLLGIYEDGTEINYQPHIDKCMVNGTIMAWNPSNEDLLSNNWVRV